MKIGVVALLQNKMKMHKECEIVASSHARRARPHNRIDERHVDARMHDETSYEAQNNPISGTRPMKGKSKGKTTGRGKGKHSGKQDATDEARLRR